LKAAEKEMKKEIAMLSDDSDSDDEPVKAKESKSKVEDKKEFKLKDDSSDSYS
jgi:hypothetical protein